MWSSSPTIISLSAPCRIGISIKTVQIAGEVKSPGTYAIKKGETLSSVLARAGGFTDKAYLLGGVLIRESTRVLQKQQLNAAIDRLEARSLASAGEKAASGADAEDAKRIEASSKQQQMLDRRLEKGGTAGKGGNPTGGSRTPSGDSQ